MSTFLRPSGSAPIADAARLGTVLGMLRDLTARAGFLKQLA
jgi:hypothetical protein